MKIIRLICWLLSLFLLTFAFLPLLYGVFNIGCYVLLAMGVGAFLLPFLISATRHKKVLRIFLFLVVGIGVTSIIFVSILMLSQAYFNKPPQEGRYTVLVLGAQVVQDYPSLTLRKRLDKAAEYLQQNPEADCIVSGGQGDDELFPEGQIMKEYLVKKGISPDRIQSEEKSTNTRENFRLSQGYIKEDSKGVVIATDSFHQLRASITAKALGIQPIYSLPSITAPALLPAYWMRDLCGVPLTWWEENVTNK